MIDSSVTTLKGLIPLLPAKDQDFAASMVKNIEKYNGATPKQKYWVAQLIARAQNPQAATPQPTQAVGSFTKVYALFAVAKKTLKFPKVRLQVADTLPVVLSMAGAKSKYEGTINVTDGGPFGQNKWYGRVAADGTWTQGKMAFPEMGQVETLLKKLGESPEATAAEYGQLTGYCCFCNRSLTDEKSTAVGYGPVCAAKFGLKDSYKGAKPLFSKLVQKEVA